jgi:transposase
MLLSYAAAHIQHMQKALELLNVKLTEVLTDITGTTGMLIIKAILRGVRDPQILAKYRRERCKATQSQIAAALQGNWREEHLFELGQALKLYQEYQRRVGDCEEKITACLRAFTDRSEDKKLPKNPRRRGTANELPRGTRELLFKMTGVDVTSLEGISESTALVLLSELGFDMSPFADEKKFASWLGLCPNHRTSAGKVKSRHVKPAASRANRALRPAAMGCARAHNAPGAFYRRIAYRCGGPKAIVATAHKIALRLYRLLKFGMDYVRQDMTAYEETYRLKLTKGLAKRAEELGYRLVPLASPV